MKANKSNTRDIGLNHGAGKGSKTRVTNVKAYRDNYDEITWKVPLLRAICGDCGKPVKLEHTYRSDHYSVVCPKCYGKV